MGGCVESGRCPNLCYPGGDSRVFHYFRDEETKCATEVVLLSSVYVESPASLSVDKDLALRKDDERVGNTLDVLAIAEGVSRVVTEVEKVIVGKRSAVELAMVAMVSGGHVLIEDIPGVGKTTLAKSLARALGCTFRRVQFTPDLLPSDITGTSVFNQKTSMFEFREGPIFANIVLADEINRATPKTQSSLLECMEEAQITSDGVTHALPRPFLVIATENNIETQGTFPLPEAQLDRFFIRMNLGYPRKEEEAQILGMESSTTGIDHVHPVLSADHILDLQALSRDVYVAGALRHYIVDVVSATRNHPQVQLGASPRGSLALLHGAQSLASLRGRTYVLADDIKELAIPVLGHRMILRPEARMKFVSASKIVEEILGDVPTPDSA
jgi:MoxR-like ATPase